ncbi:MAG: ERF family protein [Neisseriaceae bacterium]|nr:ERF family protein [Neisseriaceae bacterium]
MTPTFTEKLNKIQTELNAPKDAYNSFGKYKYRSAESILQAVKPLLAKQGLILTISDSVIQIAERIYIQATAKITDGKESVETTALAREPLLKKGMDDSQITGATSSYARKYALCGLLAIDDNKDADALNRHEDEEEKITLKTEDIIKSLNGASNLEQLKELFGYSWKYADAEQRKIIQPIYEQRKADFLAEQQA